MDFDYIVNNSIIGKKILDELNILNKKNIDKLKINQNMLKKEKEEINKIKNVASNEDLKKKVILHNQNVKKFDELKKKLSNEINKKRNEEMKKLVELIDPLLQDYMKNNSIDMILNKEIVYIAKDEYDISKAIIELTNSKYK
jgi:Skp family chaperone for outer membrane proteins